MVRRGRSPRRARRSDARERGAWARQRLFIPPVCLLSPARRRLFIRRRIETVWARRRRRIATSPSSCSDGAGGESRGTTSPSRGTARAERRRRQFIYPRSCRRAALGGWRLPGAGPAQSRRRRARVASPGRHGAGGPRRPARDPGLVDAAAWAWRLWRVDGLDHSSDSCRE